MLKAVWGRGDEDIATQISFFVAATHNQMSSNRKGIAARGAEAGGFLVDARLQVSSLVTGLNQPPPG